MSFLLVFVFFLVNGVWVGLVDDWRFLFEEFYFQLVVVLDEGIVFEIDVVCFMLCFGMIVLQMFFGSGIVVGFVFEGDGMLLFDVLDLVEFVQL